MCVFLECMDDTCLSHVVDFSYGVHAMPLLLASYAHFEMSVPAVNIVASLSLQDSVMEAPSVFGWSACGTSKECNMNKQK